MRYVINSAELYTRLQNLDKVILVKNSIPILFHLEYAAYRSDNQRNNRRKEQLYPQ